MASEYLKWKYKDVKPDEPIEYTKEEKRRNWWACHKWHVALAVLLLAILTDLTLSALHVGETMPDYRCAWVSATALPEDSRASLESALAAFGEDLNGDGKVTFHIEEYITSADNTEEGAAVVAANTMRLTADLESLDSYFFLLDDPADFQSRFAVLRRLDGTLPPDGDKDFDLLALPWTGCPALASLDLGGYSEELLGQTVTGDTGELMKTMYIARRGFWNEKTCQYPEGCDELWDILTKGAAK